MKNENEINKIVSAQSNLTDMNRIRDVLRRYFECDDDGNASPTFDEYYTAQEAIDDIHKIIGDI